MSRAPRVFVHQSPLRPVQTRQGGSGHGRVPGAYLGGLASPHDVDADRRVVLDRCNPPGSAVDTGLDAAASALWAEPAPAGGVLHPWHRLHLSPRAPAINAQRVGPILSSPYP